MTTPTLGELVTVADVDTVVRLDGTGRRLPELVLTGDVTQSLTAVLAAAASSEPGGAGFFVVGPFGCGKSHFLAAMGELLADPISATADLNSAGWAGPLAKLAAGSRRCAVVSVPLIEYRAKAALEDVVATRAWRALGRERPQEGSDRLATWDAVLAAAVDSGQQGLVLLLDELSEFLRAKQGPALTEDLRFLQFLGEWTSDHPVIVLAALQENIEEVANVSQRELARIRDRYRPSLTLSMRHVEDLVHGRLVQLRAGAEVWVDRAWEELTAAFPASPISRERFARCYPLHPDALGVLEGLRFLLSQQRGVVDFISRRLRDCLTRGYRDLITADEVYDHFEGRLHERSETARLADTVVPYYERAVAELVDDDDRNLALRTVKLLSLLAASPLERPRSAAELAAMLLVRVSALDPAANTRYLEQAILEPFATRGAYVVSSGEKGAPSSYRVVLDADAAVVARSLVAQARSELNPSDRRLVATLVELGSTPTLPLQLLAELGLSRRDIMWQNTLRAVTVGTVRFVELAADDVVQLVARARAAGAEGCVLIGEIELDSSSLADQRATVLVASTDRVAAWVPDGLQPGELDALLDIHSRRLVLLAANADGRADVVSVLRGSSESDAPAAREMLRRVYFQGHLVYPHDHVPADLPSLAGLGFERQLGAMADPLLSGLHPQHRDVMPRRELVGERILRDLVSDVIMPGRVGPAALGRGQLRSQIQGYLVPLGLAKVRNDGATMSPDPARSAAVAEVLRLVVSGFGEAVPGVELVRALADGPIGLTAPEAILVLNACVQSGLIEMRRGRKAFAEPFLALTATDRFGPGELVEPAVRTAVAAMGEIIGQGSFEPWTSATQRHAWDRAQAWLEARREELAEVRAGLVRLSDIAALTATDPGAVLDDMRLVEGLVAACSTNQPAPAGLRGLVAAVPNAAPVLAAARRLAAVARFFRDDLRRTEEAARYLTHPDLRFPASSGANGDSALASRRHAALDQLGAALRLAAEDRIGDLFAAYHEFRTAYQAGYTDAHDRYYRAVTTDDLDRVRATTSYLALARLSAVGATAVPDDRVKVDRLLAGLAPSPCHARLDFELQWKPRCSCGFAMGDREPSLDPAAIDALAGRGVRQHLAELVRPEHRDRLDDAVADLASLGRAELASDLGRLVDVASRGGSGQGDLEILVAVLAGDLPAVLSDVLGGGQLITSRDLASLREDLIGRRYTKRRLVELIAAWVDPSGEMPSSAYIEVVDSSDPPSAGLGSAGSAQSRLPLDPPSPETSATVALLAQRFPSVAGLLPDHDASDAFWLAAWWYDRPLPPPWLPVRLLEDRPRLGLAAEAAVGDAGALAELARLDRRIGPDTVLGDRVAAALDLPNRTAKEVAAMLAGERLLRHPRHLAADQFARRLAADWQLVSLLPPLAQHALATEAEAAPLTYLIEAARHLSTIERQQPYLACPSLVDDVYPLQFAPVAELISRAELAAAHGGIVSTDTIDAFRSAAVRLLRSVDADFEAHADTHYAGCLRIWEIGDAIVAPLLAQHGRVAVLLVDAMRADLSAHVTALVADSLPGRTVEKRWAVTPAPTRTAEAVAAMYLGRQVPPGSVPPHPDEADVAFAHLGYEARSLVGADRDDRTTELRTLWAEGPPISVAVATGVDERLHRTSVELAALVDEAVLALRRRVIPSLHALPERVPLVLLADHGFRENPSWGHGPQGRYVHGGTSLEECVIPVVVVGPRRLH